MKPQSQSTSDLSIHSSFQGGSLPGFPCCSMLQPSLMTVENKMLKASFALVIKWKSSWDFFELVKTGYYIGLSWKQRVLYQTFWVGSCLFLELWSFILIFQCNTMFCIHTYKNYLFHLSIWHRLCFFLSQSLFKKYF